MKVLALKNRLLKLKVTRKDGFLYIVLFEYERPLWVPIATKVEEIDIEKYWKFIAENLTEDECEELIPYEIELEEIFGE